MPMVPSYSSTPPKVQLPIDRHRSSIRNIQNRNNNILQHQGGCCASLASPLVSSNHQQPTLPSSQALEHPVSRLYVSTTTAIHNTRQVVVSWGSVSMGPTAHRKGWIPHELELPVPNKSQRGCLAALGSRGALHLLQALWCCPSWLWMTVDGNQKRRRPNGWMTDLSSRDPTQQPKCEPPTTATTSPPHALTP